MKWLVYLLLLANAAFFARQYHLMSNAPPPRPAMKPYDHVNRLLLMSEADTEKLRLRKQPSQPPAAPDPPPAPTPAVPPVTPVAAGERCYSIGPLKEDSRISAMRAWLLAMGGTPVLRVDERRELARYWVYFPPLNSREQAVQEVEQMRAQGIDDVIAVADGDMANAISLGVFSQRATLERRLRELRALGYEPMIMPRYRTEKASWFDVSFEEGERLTQDEVAARFPEAELSEARCTSGEIARGGEGS